MTATSRSRIFIDRTNASSPLPASVVHDDVAQRLADDLLERAPAA